MNGGRRAGAQQFPNLPYLSYVPQVVSPMLPTSIPAAVLHCSVAFLSVDGRSSARERKKTSNGHLQRGQSCMLANSPYLEHAPATPSSCRPASCLPQVSRLQPAAQQLVVHAASVSTDTECSFSALYLGHTHSGATGRFKSWGALRAGNVQQPEPFRCTLLNPVKSQRWHF